MQDEINEKVIALSIRTTKLTAEMLQKSIRFMLSQIKKQYDRYIKKLCTRKLYDDCGQEHYCVDEYMKRHLEIKLITAIVNMKLD